MFILLLANANSEVPATVQDRNMRWGRIELTHELGRFQSRAIFSPSGLFTGRLRRRLAKADVRIAPSHRLESRYKS